MNTKLVLATLLFSGIALNAICQEGPGTAESSSAPDISSIETAPPVQATSSAGPEYILSTAVLVFGFLVVGVVVFVILKHHNSWDDAAFRALTLPIVVFSGLFLITAGYDEHQVAPMFGLLGTLVGYVLGRRVPDASERAETRE